MQTEIDAPQLAAGDAGVATHPRGLRVLFFTELWERFSYYGMRALLVLFMADSLRGGLGLSDEVATSIYGLYTAAVYLAALPGGWLADRVFGAQQSVWYGGLLIAAGHFTLAVPRAETFYLGLTLVALGTGLLKPNVSAMVGELYPEGGARRDAGFSIFYMGINLGALLGPLACSALGEKVNWHYGFAAAGVGMVAGLVQFRRSRKHLGTSGLRPEKVLSGGERIGLACAAAAVVALVGLGIGGVLRLDAPRLASGAKTVIAAVAILYFGFVLIGLRLEREERQRVGVIAILFLASALFWAGFEQAGSSFNLFAERYTAREWVALRFTIPAGWFQSLGPAFVITLAPVFGAVWLSLARRQREPSLPVKFGLGLVLLGAGFAVMAAASVFVAAGKKAWPTWLMMTYLIHTLGELCISPVGLSSVTKLAPRRLTGQMMGTWFLATSLGNLIAGLLAGKFKAEAVQEMPGRYLQMVFMPVIAGIVLIALARPITRWMGGVR